MKSIKEVEFAKAIMNEAVDWSVFKWLWEKSTVREIADNANAALDRLNRRVKARWSAEHKEAYHMLSETGRSRSEHGEKGCKENGKAIDPEIMRVVKHVKELDDKAHSARMDAEKTFDEAERQLSTSLAREGCRKAIHSWNLHQKAIRQAEDLVEASSGTNPS